MSGSDYLLLVLAWIFIAALVVNPVYAVTSRLTKRLPRQAVRRHVLLEVSLALAYGVLLIIGVLLSWPP